MKTVQYIEPRDIKEGILIKNYYSDIIFRVERVVSSLYEKSDIGMVAIVTPVNTQAEGRFFYTSFKDIVDVDETTPRFSIVKDASCKS